MPFVKHATKGTCFFFFWDAALRILALHNNQVSYNIWKADFRNQVNAQSCAICILNTRMVLIIKQMHTKYISGNKKMGCFPFLHFWSKFPPCSMTHRPPHAILMYVYFLGSNLNVSCSLSQDSVRNWALGFSKPNRIFNFSIRNILNCHIITKYMFKNQGK